MTIGEQIQQMLPELIVDKAKSYVNFDLYDNEGHSIMTGCARRAELWDKEYNESKDFISISALKTELLNDTWIDQDFAKAVIETIENSHAFVARPQGEWKIREAKDNDGDFIGHELYCSNKTITRLQAEWICKTKSTFPQYQPDEFECSSCKQVSTQKYNFCPHCGAGMRGDKND